MAASISGSSFLSPALISCLSSVVEFKVLPLAQGSLSLAALSGQFVPYTAVLAELGSPIPGCQIKSRLC